MQYSIVGNDIALIMHYCALLKRSGPYTSLAIASYRPVLIAQTGCKRSSL